MSDVKNSTRSIQHTLSRMGIDGFLVAIIIMILLAYFFPGPGIMEKPVSLEDIAGYGLSLIFFFYGLRLSVQKLRTELVNWRMHVIVQCTTFILFPLLALLISPLFNSNNQLLWLSIFYLCALPSTVSSSVVMVSIAGGNMPAAIFNASVSTLAGIFITPLWVIPFLNTGAVHISSRDIILKLTLQVLVPVVIGVLLNRFGGVFAERNKKKLRLFDQSVILLIIYTAFCHSFYSHAFNGYGITKIILLSAGMSISFFLVFFFIKMICRFLKFNRADTITVLFCGSKKSLVHGTVMSKVLFPGAAAVSIILLPLMLYHALQLIFASVIAQKMAKAGKNKEIAGSNQKNAI